MSENTDIAAFTRRMDLEVERQTKRMRQQQELTDSTTRDVLLAGLQHREGQITTDAFVGRLRAALHTPLHGTSAEEESTPERTT